MPVPSVLNPQRFRADSTVVPGLRTPLDRLPGVSAFLRDMPAETVYVQLGHPQKLSPHGARRRLLATNSCDAEGIIKVVLPTRDRRLRDGITSGTRGTL